MGRACAEVLLLSVSVPSFTRFLFHLIDNHCYKKFPDTGSGLDLKFLGLREKVLGLIKDWYTKASGNGWPRCTSQLSITRANQEMMYLKRGKEIQVIGSETQPTVSWPNTFRTMSSSLWGLGTWWRMASHLLVSFGKKSQWEFGIPYSPLASHTADDLNVFLGSIP